MSHILSLADVGYRQFGPLPATGGGQTAIQIAEAAGKLADYEVAGAWVRRRARKKDGPYIRSFEIVDVLDQTADLRGDRLAFVDKHLCSEISTADVPSLTTESETLLSLVSTAKALLAKEARPWLGMYRLDQAINYAEPQWLKPLLRDHVLPCFFDRYPDGKIAVVRYNLEQDDAGALMRVLYGAAQAPLQEIKNEGFDGIGTLHEWHRHSLIPFGRLLLDIFLYIFYPFIGGYRGGPAGLDFLFMFEPAEKYLPGIFPRNWLAVASTTAAFGQEKVDFFKSVQSFQGPEWQHAAHQRFQYAHGYAIADRLLLLDWYVNRLNRVIYELNDVANFTEKIAPDACIDPIFAFEHYLTVDRLTRRTLLAMSLEEAGTAKHQVFEIAELYDCLSHLFGNHPDATGFFKQLFHTESGPAILKDRLGRLPAPFSSDLPRLADSLYDRIEDTIINSIWRKSKVTPQGVMVRKKKDMSQEELVLRPAFVSRLMRAYRNAHHGYFSDGDKSNKRPSRYLFLADGNLPAEITALPALWWLAYLSDPGMVGWKHLPINTFA
ncbi:MAG: hypothetical protein ABSG53_03565 [Thermoguttaceae bacterium]